MQEAGELDAGMSFHSFDTETGNFRLSSVFRFKGCMLGHPF
jgi:hypothetical protein